MASTLKGLGFNSRAKAPTWVSDSLFLSLCVSSPPPLSQKINGKLSNNFSIDTLLNKIEVNYCHYLCNEVRGMWLLTLVHLLSDNKSFFCVILMERRTKYTSCWLFCYGFNVKGWASVPSAEPTSTFRYLFRR